MAPTPSWPTASISRTEVLAGPGSLLEAGADDVSVARLREADDLLEAVRAATGGLLGEKRATLKHTLAGRRESPKLNPYGGQSSIAIRSWTSPQPSP